MHKKIQYDHVYNLSGILTIKLLTTLNIVPFYCRESTLCKKGDTPYNSCMSFCLNLLDKFGLETQGSEPYVLGDYVEFYNLKHPNLLFLTNSRLQLTIDF